MNPPTFESVESLLSFVFDHHQTALLSVDRILSFLSKSEIPSESSISRRFLLNVLSNSSQFVRAGPPHAQLFALRPKISFHLSDTAVAAHIEQLLTRNGPMTMDQFVASADFPGHDILKKVLELHSDEFAWLQDGRVWFSKSPLPVRASFATLREALEFAFSVFPNGATVEELRRLLCLTSCEETAITRLAIAKALGNAPELYPQVSRGIYVRRMAGFERPRLGEKRAASWPSWGGAVMERVIEEEDDEEKPFNPESFFGTGFRFLAD
jgi:hypothetical protein